MGFLKVELFWSQLVILCAFERIIEVALLNTIWQEYFVQATICSSQYCVFGLVISHKKVYLLRLELLAKRLLAYLLKICYICS